MTGYANLRDMLNAACQYAGMTQAAVAREIGKTPNTFSMMLGKGTLTYSDWCKIADVLGCKFVMGLSFDSNFEVEHVPADRD